MGWWQLVEAAVEACILYLGSPNMMGFIIGAGLVGLLWLSRWIRGRKQGEPSLTTPLIIFSFLLIASVGLLGVTFAYGWEKFGKPWAASLNEARYIEGLSVRFTNSEDAPIDIGGVVAVPGRLKFYADFVQTKHDALAPGFRKRVPIGEIVGDYAGEVFALPLILIRQGEDGKPRFWWANSREEVQFNPGNIVHARLAVIGTSAKEQHFYFRFANLELGSRPTMILPAEDIQWVEKWKLH